MRHTRALRTSLLVTAIALLTTTASAAPPGTARTVSRAERVRVLNDLLGRFGAADLAVDVPCRSVSGRLGGTPVVAECASASAASAGAASAGAAKADGDGTGGVEVVESAVVVTPTGLIAPVALPAGGPGAYARFYQNGDVAVDDAAGRQVWLRPGVQFIADSGVGLPRPSISPRIAFGLNPVDPTVTLGEDPYAVADLTGDGAADLAVAHYIRPGTRMPNDRSALVSVLDGRTGDVVWQHLYPGYVANLAVTGRTLVVANETGRPRSHAGENGSVSGLHAWRFEGSRRRVTAVPAWSVPVVEWARWPALELAGADRVVATWSDAPLGAEGDVLGHVVVVDVESGAVVWDAPTAGHPRQLRYDAVRGTVVVLEQDDPLTTDRPGYSLVARSLASGAVARALRSEDALPLAFQVADVTGGAPEWLVTDLTFVPTAACATSPTDELPGSVCSSALPSTGRARVIDPTTGQPLWTREQGVEQDVRPLEPQAPQPFGLQVLDSAAGPVVLVASFTSSLAETELRAYDGRTGAVRWTRREPNDVVPLFLSAYSHAGRSALLAAASRINVYGPNIGYTNDGVGYGEVDHISPFQVVLAYAADDGSVLTRNPALGDVYAAARLDVNGRKDLDLVVGGESGAVFALDGGTLGDSNEVLWRTTVSGQVRQVTVADLDGDRRDEVVVVASRSVEVLEGRTGVRRYALSYPDDFVWTATVGDVDGDQLPDVVVPARGLTAYRGLDGRQLWRLAPDGAGAAYFGTAVLTPDRTVLSQYFVRVALPGGEPPAAENQTVVAVEGATGAVRWSAKRNAPRAAPALWRGIALGEVSGRPGAVVAATWSSSGDDAGSHPQTDIYDLATGELVHSAMAENTASELSTVFVSGAGFQQANSGQSMLVSPAGDTPNLQHVMPTDVKVLPGSSRLLVSRWPSSLVVLDSGALKTLRHYGHDLAFWDRRLHTGAATVSAGDRGSYDVVAYVFDWGGYGGSQLPTGSFSYALDVVPHGFAVLTVRG